MKARALARIMSVSVADRLPILAEGLELLVEHVGQLRGDALYLIEGGRSRAAVVVDALAQEEAAKVLILLDLARLNWKDEAAARRLLENFYRHLARGIYAELAGYSPADFREAREIVDRLRRSHYLDGPNDADWIFRNEVESRREESTYVDYIQSDEGARWVTPVDRDVLVWSVGRSVDLAVALGRSGLTTISGLRLIAQEWQGVEIDDGTHWQDVAMRNRRLLQGAEDASLLRDDLTEYDLLVIVDAWGFPLHGLDLSKLQVPVSELRAEQQRTLEQLERDWLGY